jgi:dTDP-4-dehydrorhamnose reductase
MRILLTGVTGQVGRALLGPLQPIGSVVSADRALLDLSRPDDISATLDGIAPDLIINPAAYTAVDRAEDERDLALRVNGEAPAAIARWSAARGAPLIHFSTDYVFDGTGTRPWREDDQPAPLSIYGVSKLAGEEAIRASGAQHLIIRTSWVYAAKGANFLRTIARLAGEREELRIVADQIGAPTSARTIADAVVGILRASSQADLATRFTEAGGIVNVAAAGETSWHGFACAIVDGLKARGIALAAETISPIKTADYPTKAKRPANSRFDLTRLRKRFGVTTPDWRQGLDLELDALASESRSP